jgi:hypothetical protein
LTAATKIFPLGNPDSLSPTGLPPSRLQIADKNRRLDIGKGKSGWKARAMVMLPVKIRTVYDNISPYYEQIKGHFANINGLAVGMVVAADAVA